MKPIIEIKHLSKKYKIGIKQPYYSLRDTLVGMVKDPFFFLRTHKKSDDGLSKTEFWALKDVSFSVSPGDMVGVIGRNGAGKSTLLKLLSRITPPTEGELILRGRVASLLEVGAGFHPELTASENIYLNGSILGMKRWEIKEKFDEIVEFSELKKFIDTPVKFFSSGMYPRLAFSIAAFLQAEILLLDEILAVGDIGFTKKCLEKMSELKQSGRTILFVSHNLGAIMSTCNKVILLEEGRKKLEDIPAKVIESYALFNKGKKLNITKNRKGNQKITIKSLHWEDEKGREVEILYSGKSYVLVLDFERKEKEVLDDVRVSFVIKDLFGTILFLNQTDFQNQNFNNLPQKGQFRCQINRFPLVSGEYSITTNVTTKGELYDEIQDVFRFTVEMGDFFGTGHPGKPSLCKVLFKCDWMLK